jgi:hypothetical protein
MLLEKEYLKKLIDLLIEYSISVRKCTVDVLAVDVVAFAEVEVDV